MAALKENSKKVWYFVKENADKNITAADIAEGTGIDIKSVNPIITSAFQKKGLMKRTEADVEYTKEDGSTGYKTVKFITLTEEGAAIDPETYGTEAKAE